MEQQMPQAKSNDEIVEILLQHEYWRDIGNRVASKIGGTCRQHLMDMVVYLRSSK